MDYGIRIPAFFLDKMAGTEFQRLVEIYLSTFDDWYSKNETIFFREYTDHGPQHVVAVLETAQALISESSRETFSAADAAVLICSTLLHDFALHFQEESFVALVSDDNDPRGADDFGDHSWSKLWSGFVSESYRLTDAQRQEAFGTNGSFEAPDLGDPESWSKLQHRYIGEFIRQHHPRIAQEIALRGVPAANGELPLDGIDENDRLRQYSELSGLVARSHGTDLRDMFDVLNRDFNLRVHGQRCHPIYLMVLLRVSDYLQLQSERAPASILKIKRLKSPLSRSEWGIHDAVQDIAYETHADPEVVEIKVNPRKTTIELYLKIERLLQSLQKELDLSWAVLGEVYGRFPEKELAITIRRIRCNTEDKEQFGKSAGFIPEEVKFTSANSELTKLLIKPLYGDYPEIAVRELVQNAVDACRERAYLDGAETKEELSAYRVSVSVKKNEDASFSLIVEDTGVGMSLDVLKNYFLNAGSSFRSSLAWKKQFADKNKKSEILRSGKFGVGALAAFLVADDPSHVTVKVHSRRMGEDEKSAIYFSAVLSEAPISIELKPKSHVGTIIEVVTRTPPLFMKIRESEAKDEGGESWDWYCLDWPAVSRSTANGTVLPQRHHFPSSVASDEGTHNWLEPEGFTGVSWFYGRGPRVVCNGIKVIDQENFSDSAPMLFEEETIFGEQTLKIPNISVFDKNGLLPLTLDRLRIDYEQLPFLGELRSDVLDNLLAAMVVAAPERLEPKLIRQSGKLLSHFLSSISGLDGRSFGWVFSGHKVSLFSFKALGAFHGSKVVELSRPEDIEYVNSADLKDALVVVSDKGVLNSVGDSNWVSCHWHMLQDRHAMERLERLRDGRRMNPRSRNVRSVSDRREFEHEVEVFFRAFVDGLQQVLEYEPVPNSPKNRKRTMKPFRIRVGARRRRTFEGIIDYRRLLHDIYDEIHRHLSSRATSNLDLGEYFASVDDALTEGSVPDFQQAQTIIEIVKLGAQTRPKMQKKVHPKFDCVSALVDWDSIPEAIGDSDWFLSEWSVPASLPEDSSTLSKHWNACLPSLYIPQDFDQRMNELGELADLASFSRHIDRWSRLRNEFLEK